MKYKFQPGDMVKTKLNEYAIILFSNNNQYHSGHPGNSYYVKLTSNASDRWVVETDLESLENPFKVGDKVKSKQSEWEYIVKEVFFHLISFDDHGPRSYHCYHDSKNFELVPTFSVGDRIVYNNVEHTISNIDEEIVTLQLNVSLDELKVRSRVYKINKS